MIFRRYLALGAVVSVLGGVGIAWAQDIPKAGLSNFYQLWRTKDAYEGEFSCKVQCTVFPTDGGYWPKQFFIEEKAGDAGGCIGKILERAVVKGECPKPKK